MGSERGTKKPSPISLSHDKKATRKLWASPLPPKVTDLTFVLLSSLSHRLEDEWLPLSAVPRTRSVKICHLPEAAKVKLHADLFCRRDHPTEGEGRETPNNSPSSASVSSEGPPRGASRRKQKWPTPRPVAVKGTEDGAAAII